MQSTNLGGVEYVNCDLCGSNITELLFVGKDRMHHKSGQFGIVRCNICGLIYINPRPTPEMMSQYYPIEYAPFRRSGNPVVQFAKGMMSRYDVSELRKLIGKDAAILEIGCATGEYLALLRDLSGWAVTGVEISPFASEKARREFGLNTITGTIFDAEFPDESFDLVKMKYVLEHLHNPSKTLAEVYRILRKNGKLVLWVPNVESFEVKLFGKYWYGFDIPRHLYDYSPRTLKKVLESSHFRICDLQFSPVPNNWIGSLRYVAEEIGVPSLITGSLNIDNVFLLALLAPLSIALGTLGQSGRIRIVAERD